MTFVVATVAPDEIDASGGTRLLFSGDFTGYLGREFVVEFEPTGGGDAVRGLSGVSGKPTIVFPTNATKLYCYSPKLEAGDYDVTVKLADDSEQVVLGSPVTMEKRQYQTKVFELRRVYPPDFRVGPRAMDQLEPV